MAIAAILDFPGGTLEQYDQFVAAMGMKTGGAAMRGLIFHWVARTDDGTRIVDVWETREDFDSWAFGLPELGPSAPQITFYDVHHILAAAPSAGR